MKLLKFKRFSLEWVKYESTISHPPILLLSISNQLLFYYCVLGLFLISTDSKSVKMSVGYDVGSFTIGS